MLVLPLVGMLATVYLPPLASHHVNGKMDDYRSLVRRMNMEFFAVGLIGPLATPIIFGPAYDAARPLWPGFGVFVMLQVLGTAYGTQLVAWGQIRWRVGVQIVALAVTCGALVLLLPVDGILAAPWILSGVALILLLSYGEAAARQYKDVVSIRRYCLVYCTIAAGIFVGFW